MVWRLVDLLLDGAPEAPCRLVALRLDEPVGPREPGAAIVLTPFGARGLSTCTQSLILVLTKGSGGCAFTGLKGSPRFRER